MRREMSDFELAETLGVGTVGTIYHAQLKDSGEEVALKVLLPSVSNDPLIKARFRREMVILERVSHPNIVHYLGGGQDGAQLFYAMEYVDDLTLSEVVRSHGPMPPERAVPILRQICDALAEARTLAHELAALPQNCLRSDRLSSYEQWGSDLGTALARETELGWATIASGETLEGASRFAAGAGRHGAPTT